MIGSGYPTRIITGWDSDCYPFKIKARFKDATIAEDNVVRCCWDSDVDVDIDLNLLNVDIK